MTKSRKKKIQKPKPRRVMVTIRMWDYEREDLKKKAKLENISLEKYGRIKLGVAATRIQEVRG